MYWAGFIGEKKMIDKFLDELGFSPFMKLIEGQSVIDGCVKGGQYQLLEYLIKDTRQNFNDGKKKKDEIVRYMTVNVKDQAYYWKSR
jgi:hypothetical protein